MIDPTDKMLNVQQQSWALHEDIQRLARQASRATPDTMLGLARRVEETITSVYALAHQLRTVRDIATRNHNDAQREQQSA